MKAIFIPLCLALASCTSLGIPMDPPTVADRTTLDERVATGIELVYQATAQWAINTGAAKREDVKAADRRAYAAVGVVRAAYRSGNAASYEAAAVAAQGAVTDLMLAIKGN